ncbi:MAG: glutaredoxin family protein [Pirellulales bacterium]
MSLLSSRIPRSTCVGHLFPAEISHKFTQSKRRVYGICSDIILYTRNGCHLCEDARQLLLRYGIEPKEIDVDEDAALEQLYGECVPVVLIDGQVRFRGRVNETLLRRLLHELPHER